jgi:hypothetical protein
LANNWFLQRLYRHPLALGLNIIFAPTRIHYTNDTGRILYTGGHHRAHLLICRSFGATGSILICPVHRLQPREVAPILFLEFTDITTGIKKDSVRQRPRGEIPNARLLFCDRIPTLSHL